MIADTDTILRIICDRVTLKFAGIEKIWDKKDIWSPVPAHSATISSMATIVIYSYCESIFYISVGYQGEVILSGPFDVDHQNQATGSLFYTLDVSNPNLLAQIDNFFIERINMANVQASVMNKVLYIISRTFRWLSRCLSPREKGSL